MASEPAQYATCHFAWYLAQTPSKQTNVGSGEWQSIYLYSFKIIYYRVKHIPETETLLFEWYLQKQAEHALAATMNILRNCHNLYKCQVGWSFEDSVNFLLIQNSSLSSVIDISKVSSRLVNVSVQSTSFLMGRDWAFGKMILQSPISQERKYWCFLKWYTYIKVLLWSTFSRWKNIKHAIYFNIWITQGFWMFYFHVILSL